MVADAQAGDVGDRARHRPARLRRRRRPCPACAPETSPRWCRRVAEGHLEHRQALEVVAADVLVGDADAAVQLDALLADEAHALAQLHLGLATARAAAAPRARRA